MTPEEIEPSTAPPIAARRGDGLLVIVQNNAEKTLTISKINEALENMLGYAKDEILNRRLETILGTHEAEAIADDLEYDADAEDFGDIFARIREVRLRRRLGDEIRVNCKLSRMMAEGMNSVFQIVIPDEQERVSRAKMAEFITTNLDGRKELDEATGLPNRKTAVEFLPLLKNYFEDSKTNIVFAVLRVDRHEKSLAKYGAEATNHFLLHVYQICRSTFRSEDLIFALSDHTLGVVLFNITRESARVVLNRLRWKIRSHHIDFGGKPNFIVTTCIGFDLIDFEDVYSIFANCETAMAELDANERNTLVELGQP